MRRCGHRRNRTLRPNPGLNPGRDVAKSAYELVAERFGVRVRAVQNPEIIQATTTDRIMLRANPMRYGFVVVNMSADTCYLRPVNPAAAASGGMVLLPNGSISVSLEEDFTLASLEWHILGAAVNLAIFVLSIEGEPDGE